jgi:copper chaperone CopZ
MWQIWPTTIAGALDGRNSLDQINELRRFVMTIQSKILQVIGEQTMHCAGCETAVKFALKQLPGVQRVEANHKMQQIKLTFDSQALGLERVRRELDEIGYQVAEVEAC